VQDSTVESEKKWKKNSFGLLELEMADLECFWRKTPLGPLGVKSKLLEIFITCIYTIPRSSINYFPKILISDPQLKLPKITEGYINYFEAYFYMWAWRAFRLAF
jgi:hypothetical protein